MPSAFKRRDARFSGDGSYGMNYGTGPYGGQGWPPLELPTPHLGSDDLARRDRVFSAEVRHKRHGATVAVRKWGDFGVWRVRYFPLGTTPTESRTLLDALRAFFDARRFRLLPNIDDETTFYEVAWVEPLFDPDDLRNGFYAIEFTIEEVP